MLRLSDEYYEMGFAWTNSDDPRHLWAIKCLGDAMHHLTRRDERLTIMETGGFNE